MFSDDAPRFEFAAAISLSISEAIVGIGYSIVAWGDLLGDLVTNSPESPSESRPCTLLLACDLVGISEEEALSSVGLDEDAPDDEDKMVLSRSSRHIAHTPSHGLLGRCLVQLYCGDESS